MTDEDLIHQLRNSKGWPTLGHAAADRIEALIRERDAITDALVDAVSRQQFYKIIAALRENKMEKSDGHTD